MAKKDKDFEYEFNPVKELQGGEQAQQVIWSTRAIEVAVEAIKKGLPLKVNPFIGNNTKLLKPELVFKRTDAEVADYIHCMQDICYFAEKCHVMTPEGLQQIKLRDYQRRYLQHLQNHRFSLYLACRQAGKSLSLLSEVVISLNINKINENHENKFNENVVDLLKKYYFYIKDNDIIIELPLFEIFNLYNNSMIWKIRYHLYKYIYKLIKWQDKKESNQMMKAQDTLNITKQDTQNGQ